MSFFKKIKDILFDEEEIAQNQNIRKEEEVPVKKEIPKVESYKQVTEEVPVVKPKPITSDHDIYKKENTFPFPEFDEDEFENNLGAPKGGRVNNSVPPSVPRSSAPTRVHNQPRTTNAMEYERIKKIEKRTEYNRLEKTESSEYKEKRKFKPSPIISPVYGVLNEDYKPEDVKTRTPVDTDTIDVDSVRKKAFGGLKDTILDETMNMEPTKVVYEEMQTVSVNFPEYKKEEKVKTIDELLGDTADVKVSFDEEFDITEEVPVPSYNEIKPQAKEEPIIDEFDKDDTLENDLFDLIDSMYESRDE